MSEGTASGGALGAPKHGSVFDFLYHDARRTASFLAQLDPDGHLTGIKRMERVEETSSDKSGASAQGGIPTLARAQAMFEGQRGKVAGEAAERTYDPLWANARALLDYLDERDMIRRDVASARIGEFVLVTGGLTMMDLSLFKTVWSLPAMRELAIKGAAQQQQPDAPTPEARNRQERRALTKKVSNNGPSLEARQQVEGAFAIVGMLPHTVQARVTQPDKTVVWSSLREDGLVTSAADLMLKHGSAIAGQWSALGVLDALPDADAEGNLTDSGIQSIISALSLSGSAFGKLLVDMEPHIRPMLGRPFQAYGITPLLIFREVSAG